jgi:hypothetical protein
MIDLEPQCRVVFSAALGNEKSCNPAYIFSKRFSCGCSLANAIGTTRPMVFFSGTTLFVSSGEKYMRKLLVLYFSKHIVLLKFD